tara:strand:- start:2907 stop:3104 length:198 start_codon:yes stop_codon:yes gene_type:complete
LSDEEKKLYWQLKKISPENTGLSGLNSGVGGIRTRVQTSDKRAFYKFRFRLILELELTENCPYKP